VWSIKKELSIDYTNRVVAMTHEKLIYSTRFGVLFMMVVVMPVTFK